MVATPWDLVNTVYTLFAFDVSCSFISKYLPFFTLSALHR